MSDKKQDEFEDDTKKMPQQVDPDQESQLIGWNRASGVCQGSSIGTGSWIIQSDKQMGMTDDYGVVIASENDQGMNRARVYVRPIYIYMLYISFISNVSFL
jgi:hypothetical protein